MTEPALLGHKIRAALAPCRLGERPTPLEPAPGLAQALHLAELLVKREDRSSARAGGNKVRGLEFLFAGVAPGAVFVTVGATGSTHCLATAVHAARVGGRAVLVQFPQPETRESRAVAAACAGPAGPGGAGPGRGGPPPPPPGPPRGAPARRPPPPGPPRGAQA